MAHTFIIAEIGPNHNGDLGLALRMVDELSSVGVDAVKFQLANPNELLSLDAIKADYQKKNNNDEDLFKAAQKRQLSHDEHRALSRRCGLLGVEYLCTGFDMSSVTFLDRCLNVKRFKIPSGEILTTDILRYVANRDKPIILSTGMATYDEIDAALTRLNMHQESDITLLHCVSNYPVPVADVNLLNMAKLRERFGYPVGYSDHTLGNEAAIAAVALGAVVIEKHVTVDRNLPGPDHKASATIEQFSDLVQSIRKVEKILGRPEKVFSKEEEKIALVSRKSIVAKHELLPGHIIHERDVCFKRPGTGFSPTEIDKVIGKRVHTKIEANRVIKFKDFTQ